MTDALVFEKGKLPKHYQDVRKRDFKNNKNAVLNPRLHKVLGTPLEYWKKGNGRRIEIETKKSERDKIDAKKAQLRSVVS